MSTLFRYMTQQLLVTTMVVTVVLCLIFWLAKASTLLDFILNRGLDFGFFLYMSLLILPRLLIIILPIATFATLLFAYYRLQTDSELVVIHAAGGSPCDTAAPTAEPTATRRVSLSDAHSESCSRTREADFMIVRLPLALERMRGR